MPKLSTVVIRSPVRADCEVNNCHPDPRLARGGQGKEPRACSVLGAPAPGGAQRGAEIEKHVLRRKSGELEEERGDPVGGNPAVEENPPVGWNGRYRVSEEAVDFCHLRRRAADDWQARPGLTGRQLRQLLRERGWRQDHRVAVLLLRVSPLVRKHEDAEAIPFQPSREDGAQHRQHAGAQHRLAPGALLTRPADRVVPGHEDQLLALQLDKTIPLQLPDCRLEPVCG